MMSDYFNLALRNLKKRRLRAFLTLLGILIAISTIFVLISLSLGLEQVIQDQFEELGGDKFFIQPRGQLGPPGTEAAAQLTESDVDTVSKIPGVREVTYYTIGSARIESKDNVRFASVAGVGEDNLDLFYESFTVDVAEGRRVEKGDGRKVTIGSQYKHNNFFPRPIEVGDTIEINDVEFKVKGIMEPVGNQFDDRIISMPEEEFRALFEIPARIDFIIVQVDDADEINEIADRTERRLRNSRDVDEKTQDFTILTPEELLESFGNVLNIVTAFLLGIAGISLFVGGVGIANTMYTSVLERTKEIGVMKAIGAQNKDILLIFLIEAGLLGIVGGLAGVILGLGINAAIEYIAVTQLATNLLTTTTPLWLFIFSLSFAFLAGAISGLLPARHATKIKPVEALRYE